MKFIHAADVHLSAESPTKEYSFSVLREIGRIAEEEEASLILFAGDTFDSFPDATALRKEFGAWTNGLPEGMHVLLLPGNHEELRKGGNVLASLSFGTRTRLFTNHPYDIFLLDGTEFILFPFRSGPLATSQAAFLPKSSRVRVLVMHGTVAGMAYMGAASTEEEDSNIDPGLFEKLDADYVAMGHLHGGRSEKMGNATVVYPGSARVWRKGEYGPRTIVVVDTDSVGTPADRTLDAAGEYREERLLLTLDGKATVPDAVSGTWGKNDKVLLVLTGMVDDENAVVRLKEEIERTFRPRVREFDVECETQPVAGISSHPAAVRFLEEFEKIKESGLTNAQVLERARYLGLREIAKKMEVEI